MLESKKIEFHIDNGLIFQLLLLHDFQIKPQGVLWQPSRKIFSAFQLEGKLFPEHVLLLQALLGPLIPTINPKLMMTLKSNCL